MKYSMLAIATIILMAGCSPTIIGGNETIYPDDANSNLNPTSIPALSVDLSQVTPSVNPIGENVVIPAPRSRESKAKLLHDISLDVSKRLGVDIGDVILVKVDEIIWPDESLGCPAPDINYVQSPTSGFQVVVKAQDTEYTYHTKGFGMFIWCNDGTPISPNN